MITESPSFMATERGSLRSMLQQVLMQESRLAAMTHDYVWMRGSPLQSLKRLMAEQGRQIDRWVADLGGCARALGLTELAAPAPRDDSAARLKDPIRELLQRHEAIVRELLALVQAVTERDPDGDAAAMLGGLLEFHQTSAWMLRLVLRTPTPEPDPSRVV